MDGLVLVVVIIFILGFPYVFPFWLILLCLVVFALSEVEISEQWWGGGVEAFEAQRWCTGTLGILFLHKNLFYVCLLTLLLVDGSWIWWKLDKFEGILMVLTVGFSSSVPNISQLSLVVEFLVFRRCRIGDEAGLCLLSSQWPEGRTFHPCSVCFLLPFF